MIVNTLLFSWVLFLFSVQFALMASFALHFFPPVSSLPRIVFPEWQYLIRPEREGFFFHMFVTLAFALQAAGLWAARGKLSNAQWGRALVPFALVQTLAVFLLIAAAFKMTVYAQRPGPAEKVFAVLACIAIAVEIFWVECARIGRRALSYALDVVSRPWMDACVLMFLVLALYVPDGDAVLARMFLGEQFHHFDSFMAPAWAAAKGCVLNVDIMTEYGIGVPVLIAWLAKLCGGFSYAHVFYVWVWGAIVYFALCFIFLRRWLGSLGISIIAIVFALKTQMFHPGIDPFIFTLPSATVGRYWWDMVFFLCILAHLRGGWFWLMAAGAVCGIEIFHMTTSGYCLTLAFALYLGSLALTPSLRAWALSHWRGWIIWLTAAAAVPLTAFILFYYTQGTHLFTAEFWRNMAEFNNYFLAAFGLMPMTETLQNKEVLANFMGFFIPAVYMLTLMIVASQIYFNLCPRRDILAGILSFYGLALYHYYVARSAPTSYYVVAVPYACILGFWLQRAVGPLKPRTARAIVLGLTVVSLCALLTTHTYLKYPNLLCLSSSPMVDPNLVTPLPDGRSYFNQLWTKIPEGEKLPRNSLGEKDEDLRSEKDFTDQADLKAYYYRESDFSDDAALIASLTSASGPAAVLSSFEIKMLMQADRKPFFYYSPILLARPMRLRTYPNSTMYSLGHAQRTLRQLQERRPEYIFMEKIYLDRVHMNLLKDASLQAVLDYIFTHYAVAQQGHYLVAMKYIVTR